MLTTLHYIYYYKIGIVYKIYLGFNNYFIYYILSYYSYYLGVLLKAL
jgi:hypothetical protein